MIDVETLREMLSYDPITGLFTWLVAPNKSVKAGDIAGRIHQEGYRYIGLKNKVYRASHLVWIYMTGEWPKAQIDHRDHNPSNDRFDNLREATNGQNSAHKRCYGKHGLKGLRRRPACNERPWQARIRIKGTLVNLGYYATKEEAHAAYCKAAESEHGEFFHP